ncbi:MAG: hypothetical protein WA584_11480 [Pyrinomonadaceae bacterium]
MIIQSKRAKEIDAHIASHECEKGLQKVEINGKITLLKSYDLPWTLLQYNHDNGRFNLEIQEYETQLGRSLDPTLSEDTSKIKELLLQDDIEAKKLKEDLKLVGEQREVAAITFDGVVVNGNRRMATLEQLHNEESSGKWSTLWVVRLPPDISEKDLWKIEAGLQLSKEKVADYGPVNNLLMIKEGKRAGLNNSEIAASMYGWTEQQVAFELERLDLIDIFLQFFGQPNNYGLIKKFRLNEHFIDLQKMLVKKLRDNGTAKRVITNKLEIAFLYLRGHIENADFNVTHYDIRNICKILLDNDATNALTESFEHVKDLKQISVTKLADNLDKATDVKKNREDSEKPAKLIDRAIAALNGIDRKGDHYKSDFDVKKKLGMLDKLVQKLKRELGLINDKHSS